MKRRVLKFLPLLSLLLCIASLGLWIRSIYFWDLLALRVGRYHLLVNTIPDRLGLSWMVRHGPPGKLEMRFIPSHVTGKVGRHGLDFSIGRGSGMEYDTDLKATYNVSGFGVGFPIWIIAVITAVPMMNRIEKRVRRRLRRPGSCPSCGYDLRASRERCPECGTPVQQPSAQSAGPPSRSAHRDAPHLLDGS